MSRYLTCHTIACMTRQQLEKLLSELKSDDTVHSVRFVADFAEGRLICEFEASDQETLLAFLTVHNMRQQWVLRAELDVTPPVC